MYFILVTEQCSPSFDFEFVYYICRQRFTAKFSVKSQAHANAHNQPNKRNIHISQTLARTHVRTHEFRFRVNTIDNCKWIIYRLFAVVIHFMWLCMFRSCVFFLSLLRCAHTHISFIWSIISVDNFSWREYSVFSRPIYSLALKIHGIMYI